MINIFLMSVRFGIVPTVRSFLHCSLQPILGRYRTTNLSSRARFQARDLLSLKSPSRPDLREIRPRRAASSIQTHLPRPPQGRFALTVNVRPFRPILGRTHLHNPVIPSPLSGEGSVLSQISQTSSPPRGPPTSGSPLQSKPPSSTVASP